MQWSPMINMWSPVEGEWMCADDWLRYEAKRFHFTRDWNLSSSLSVMPPLLRVIMVGSVASKFFVGKNMA